MPTRHTGCFFRFFLFSFFLPLSHSKNCMTEPGPEPTTSWFCFERLNHSTTRHRGDADTPVVPELALSTGIKGRLPLSIRILWTGCTISCQGKPQTVRSPSSEWWRNVGLTPWLPHPVKLPGCKVHTYTPANSVFDGPVTNLTFNTVHFDRNPFACSCKGDKKALMVWHFTLLLVVFRVSVRHWCYCKAPCAPTLCGRWML